MYGTRTCPQCGNLFLKSEVCPDCQKRTEPTETIEKREPKMDLVK